MSETAATAREELARPVRDCQHPNTRHEHGTRNAYVCDRCRCEPCTIAARNFERSRRREKLYGRYDGLVDAEPVREHIRALSRAGVGMKQITRLSGVSGGVLTKLVYGHPLPDGTKRPPSRRCTPRVRDRVLSVTADSLAGGALVDGAGTRRRLEALICQGWSGCKLAARLGMARANFGKTIRADTVRQSTADAVKALYDELWDTSVPEATHRDRIAASRARNHARAHGYASPLAWDDDTIDDPTVAPALGGVDVELDEVAVQRFMDGTLRDTGYHPSPERIEAIHRLHDIGLSDGQIAVRLRMTQATVCANRLRKPRREEAA